MCDGDLDTILSLISTKINKIFCDREFIGCVQEDLDIIIKDDQYCVLFPKLKPIFLKVLRYQAVIFDLSVFCIGIGPKQVIVVCKKITKEPTDECPSATKQKTSKVMDAEENLTKGSKKSRIRPTQSYYVPPAQRSVSKKKRVIGNCTSKKIPSKEVHDKFEDESSEKETSITISEAVLLVNATNRSLCSSHIIDTSVNFSDPNCSTNQNSLNVDCLPKEEINETTCEKLPKCVMLDNLIQVENGVEVEVEETVVTSDNSIEGVSQSAVAVCDISDTVQYESTSLQKDKNIDEYTETHLDSNLSDLYISFNDEIKKKTDDCDTDNEKEEMQRAIENISRKRRPLIKNIHDDTLWANENKVVSQRTTNLTENAKNKSNSEVECDEEGQNQLADWEDMFDENGELHSDYIGEILKQIGCDVKVVKATHDYSAYENTKYQDLEHVIELYDFPSSLRTQDIMQLYRGASENPMYVKWCDDTHCLLVLSSPAQAQRALQIEHDIIKSRPLRHASTVAAFTASSSDLKPAMKRPQTNMQTARRLINTHLGTKSSLSKEEVELERQALREAREQRRLERQSEKDAWDGHPRNAKS